MSHTNVVTIESLRERLPTLRERVSLADRQRAIREIIRNFRTQAALAGILGLSQSTVSLWVTKGEIPPNHARDILALAADGVVDVKPADFFAPRDMQAGLGLTEPMAA